MAKKFTVTGLGNIQKIGSNGSGPSVDTYSKTEIDTKLLELYETLELVKSQLTALINNKTSAEAHYLKNKAQLVEGQNISLIMNDSTQTITFDVSTTPEPAEPTADGIYSYDTTKKIYRKYDPATIFTNSGDIAYCEGNFNNEFPSTFDKTIARQIFNEPIFLIFKNVDELTINNLFQLFLANCTNFNYPLDFQDVDNLTVVGPGFLYGCMSFNSTITFKDNKIVKISDNFMFGCEAFNNQINHLYTPALKEIRQGFLTGCISFNQNVNFAQTSLDSGAYNKVMLIGFMYNCTNFSTGKIILGNKGLSVFKQTGYAYNLYESLFYSCATSYSTAPCYQIGFHFEGNNISKTDFDNFIIQTENGLLCNVFKNSNENPYKKIIVNGVE